MARAIAIFLLCIAVVMFIPEKVSAGYNSLLATAAMQGSILWSGIEYEYRIKHFGLGFDLEGSYVSSDFIGGVCTHLITRGYFLPEGSTINGFLGLNLGTELFVGYGPGEVVVTFDPSLTLGLDVNYKNFIGRIESGYNPVMFFYDGSWVHSVMVKIGIGLSF